MISVYQMGEVLGKVSGCSCTQLAEFYSAEAGVSIRRCCFRIGGIYPKLRRYHLVDLAVKHDCEMVSVTYKF